MVNCHHEACTCHANPPQHCICNKGMECNKNQPSANQNTFPVEGPFVGTVWRAKWAIESFWNMFVDFLITPQLVFCSSIPNAPVKPIDEKRQWKHTGCEKLSCFNRRCVKLWRTPIEYQGEWQYKHCDVTQQCILPPLQTRNISVDKKPIFRSNWNTMQQFQRHFCQPHITQQ